MVELGKLKENDIEDSTDLENLGVEARQFLQNHPWCAKINEGFFDRGFAYAAVFYFKISPRPGSGADNEVWVIAGDLSPAFLDIPSCPNGATALEAYVICMEDWADAVLEGTSTHGMMPVFERGSSKLVKPTKDLAVAMKSRMEFIRRELLSQWEDEITQWRESLPDPKPL